ncbi:MAG: hypothetical protein LBI37_00375 [Puniceicoccales bacterium]|nr:hypothetical protein [Puniceicoccales bacterium]
MANLFSKIPDGTLSKSSLRNIREWYACDDPQKIIQEVIFELANAGEFNELNNRFFKTLTFGTGGIRGRTVGDYITMAENGKSPNASPEFPAIGSTCLNHFNIIRATMSLHKYCKKVMDSQGHKLLLVVA